MLKMEKKVKTAMAMTMGMLLVLAMGLALAHGGQHAGRGGHAGTVGGQITDEAREALLEALAGPEGEYAAYAMYNAVIEKYGDVEPYVSIRRAESHHIDALQRQLDNYGIDYPKENPYIGKVDAPDSLKEAAEAWAAGEIANVEMYDRLMAKVEDYPNLVRVFNNLRSASLDRHLPIFKAAAENGGSLTPAQMQEIGSAHGHGAGGSEHGNGRCNHKGGHGGPPSTH